MIQIRENTLDSSRVAIEVDGVIDQGAIPILKSVCDRYLGGRMQVLLDLEGVVHITREGRHYLDGIKEKALILNLPEFMKLDFKT